QGPAVAADAVPGLPAAVHLPGAREPDDPVLGVERRGPLVLLRRLPVDLRPRARAVLQGGRPRPGPHRQGRPRDPGPHAPVRQARRGARGMLIYARAEGCSTPALLMTPEDDWSVKMFSRIALSALRADKSRPRV